MSNQNIHITTFSHYNEISWLPLEKIEKGNLSHEEYRVRRMINIDKKVSKETVDRIIMTLIVYNDWDGVIKSGIRYGDYDKKDIFDQLCDQMEKKNLRLPGGLLFEDGDTQIMCGCCFDVNDWYGAAKELIKHYNAWLGHDPDVHFDSDRENHYRCTISDNTYKHRRRPHRRRGFPDTRNYSEDEENEETKRIEYSVWDFDIYMNRLYKDFEGFVRGPLRKRVKELSPSHAKRFCRAFRICFKRDKDKEREMEERKEKFVTDVLCPLHRVYYKITHLFSR